MLAMFYFQKRVLKLSECIPRLGQHSTEREQLAPLQPMSVATSIKLPREKGTGLSKLPHWLPITQRIRVMQITEFSRRKKQSECTSRIFGTRYLLYSKCLYPCAAFFRLIYYFKFYCIFCCSYACINFYKACGVVNIQPSPNIMNMSQHKLKTTQQHKSFLTVEYNQYY